MSSLHFPFLPWIYLTVCPQANLVMPLLSQGIFTRKDLPSLDLKIAKFGRVRVCSEFAAVWSTCNHEWWLWEQLYLPPLQFIFFPKTNSKLQTNSKLKPLLCFGDAVVPGLLGSICLHFPRVEKIRLPQVFSLPRSYAFLSSPSKKAGIFLTNPTCSLADCQLKVVWVLSFLWWVFLCFVLVFIMLQF